MSIAPAIDDLDVLPHAAAAQRACTYCGSTKFDPLYSGIRDRLGYVPGEWSYDRCAGCGSGQLRPFPKTEDLAAFYPPVYAFSPELASRGLKRLLSGLEYRLFFRPTYRAQARIVDRQVRRRGAVPGKLLDIGCGRGLRLLDFRELGYDVHGMDFVSDAVEYVNRTLGIPAVCTDATHLAEAFEPASFDVITAFHVVEHIIELDAVVDSVVQLLKPGGWFAAAVPLIDSLQSRVFGKRWIAVADAPRHVAVPTQSGLAELFKRHGFDKATLQLISDSSLSNSAGIGMSLLPRSSTTATYGSSRLFGLAFRLLGAAATLAGCPLSFVENYALRRPAQCIFFAKKSS